MLLAFRIDDDAREAFDVLAATLARNGTAVRGRVGYKGGFVDSDVTWHGSVGMWSLLDSEQADRRFWCCFGVDDPRKATSVDIAVEINPRHHGTDLLVAGAFAKDARGAVHLCHNGKIGGGRKGVGKSAFFRHFSDPGGLKKMLYQGKHADVVDLSPVTSPELPRRLAWFAREVARIKVVCAETEDGKAPDRGTVARGMPIFSPEFSGRRAAFSLAHQIEASADHGLVVDALAAAVKDVGCVPYNDGARDLFVLDESNRMSVLFEVKTDLTTTSIYTAVGQLLLNGGAGRDAPRMVLVVPGNPKPKTREALRSVGVAVLAFEWRGNRPVIEESELGRLIR